MTKQLHNENYDSKIKWRQDWNSNSDEQLQDGSKLITAMCQVGNLKEDIGRLLTAYGILDMKNVQCITQTGENTSAQCECGTARHVHFEYPLETFTGILSDFQ